MRTDKRRNDGRILDAATKLFHEISVDATSLDEIAREAQVTRATLYNHFKDKMDLLERILVPALEESSMAMEELLSRPVARLNDLSDTLWELYRTWYRPMEISGCRQASGIESVAQLHRRFVTAFTAYLTRVDEEEKPLAAGVQTSVRLVGSIYLPVLHELATTLDDNDVPVHFRRVMEGVLR